jgi:hypothetical protein
LTLVQLPVIGIRASGGVRKVLVTKLLGKERNLAIMIISQSLSEIVFVEALRTGQPRSNNFLLLLLVVICFFTKSARKEATGARES